MNKNETLKELFKKYNLYYDQENPNSKENDVFVHKHYKIITRQGIQKIEKSAGIYCDIQVVDSISTPHNVTMRGVGIMNGNSYITFASASSETSQNQYYAEMAEKRCRSRLVLTLAGLYELGVFGQDESDQFSAEVEKQKNSKIATYRGGANE